MLDLAQANEAIRLLAERVSALESAQEDSDSLRIRLRTMGEQAALDKAELDALRSLRDDRPPTRLGDVFPDRVRVDSLPVNHPPAALAEQWQTVLGAELREGESEEAHECGDNVDREDGTVGVCVRPDGHYGCCEERRVSSPEPSPVEVTDALAGTRLLAQVSALKADSETARRLLGRIEKYAAEDKAVTPGSTRLARVLREAGRFLTYGVESQPETAEPTPNGSFNSYYLNGRYLATGHDGYDIIEDLGPVATPRPAWATPEMVELLQSGHIECCVLVHCGPCSPEDCIRISGLNQALTRHIDIDAARKALLAEIGEQS